MTTESSASSTGSQSAPQLDVSRAARIAGVAQLQAIVLRELRWDFPENNVPGGLPIEYEPEFEAAIGTTPEAAFYKIRTSIRATVPDGTEIFRLNSDHQLIFRVPDGQNFDLEEHQAFASTSVLFMAYPYIRELVQSTAAKAGMPMVVLPPLRFGPSMGQESPSEEQAARDQA